MSHARSELFAYLGAALATLIGLFVLQRLYGSFIDNQYHANLAAAAPSEAGAAAREEDNKLLMAGKLPLDAAMQRMAQRGRGSFGSIAPQPSEDLSALSGWIHLPGFKPAIAHPIRTPRVEPVAPPPVVEAAPAPAPEPIKAQPTKAPSPNRKAAR